MWKIEQIMCTCASTITAFPNAVLHRAWREFPSLAERDARTSARVRRLRRDVHYTSIRMPGETRCGIDRLTHFSGHVHMWYSIYAHKYICSSYVRRRRRQRASRCTRQPRRKLLCLGSLSLFAMFCESQREDVAVKGIFLMCGRAWRRER